MANELGQAEMTLDYGNHDDGSPNTKTLLGDESRRLADNIADMRRVRDQVTSDRFGPLANAPKVTARLDGQGVDLDYPPQSVEQMLSDRQSSAHKHLLDEVGATLDAWEKKA